MGSISVNLTIGLHRAVRHQPDNVATIFGNRRRTFRELEQRVARLADGLKALGVAWDDRIAILSLNSDKFLETYLATWWAGAAINPVNTRWAVREIVYSLEDSQSTILFIDSAHKHLVSDILAGAPSVRHVIYMDTDDAPQGASGYEALIAQSEPIPDAFRGGDDICGVFYTGGTTGFPKGVLLSHTNIGIPSMVFLCGEYGFGDVVLHTAAMFHAAPLLFILAQLFRGGRHVIIPGFDPGEIVRQIAREGVTDVLLVPSMLQMMVNRPDVAKGDYSSLQRLWYGGSTIPQTVQEKALQVFSPAGMMQLYGMTEIPVSALLTPAFHDPQLGKLRSAGRAAIENEIMIADDEGNEVPRGEVGEIWVRGLNVMKGYLNRPEENAKSIVNGWLRTGDAAHMDGEGFIFFADRKKDMIVTGGENVFAAEVENAVATHPSVEACAVIGIPDEKWGEAIHAVIVLKAGAEMFTATEIREYCRSMIAGYKCPRSVEFKDALPLSAFGKVTKNVLREPYLKKAGAIPKETA